jgi:hypothetical protein
MKEIPDAVLDKHLGILGINGSGKTYTAKGAAEHLLDQKRRVCIIDPTGVWHGLRSSANGKRGAYPVVIFGGSHADIQISGTHGEAIAEAIGTSSTPAIIDTSLMKIGERTRFFADFAETLRIKNNGPLHLFIDEAHLFAPQGRVSDPQSAGMLHAANNLISLGRSRGLRVTLISQRPAKLHKDSLSQVHSLISMRLIAPQDRAAVEGWIADQADPAQGKAIIASLPSLKTGEGWLWAPEAKILERMTFPKISTFDSSKTPDGKIDGAGPVLAPIDLDAIQTRLETVKTDAFANDPGRLKRRIADLERAAKNTSPSSDSKAIEEAYKQGYAARAEEESIAFAAFRATLASKIFDEISNSQLPAGKEKRQVKGPKLPITYAVHQIKGQELQVAPPSDDLPNPQKRVLRALHFWHSVGEDNPTREQVAGVAGYSPGSGGFNNIIGAMRSAGLIASNSPGTLTLPQTTPGYEMDQAEARDMLLSVLSNPHKKIVEVFNGSDQLARDDVAQKSGYSAGSGGFNNLVGRLNTLNILERPAQGMLAMTNWARTVLQ